MVQTFLGHVDPIIYQRYRYGLVCRTSGFKALYKVRKFVHANEPLVTPLTLSFVVSLTGFVLLRLLLIGWFDHNVAQFHALYEFSDIVSHAVRSLKPLHRYISTKLA